MPQDTFFKPEPNVSIQETHTLKDCFEAIPYDSLLVLDIDDTLARLPHTLGLDPWFRYRIEQYQKEYGSHEAATSLAVALYTAVQLASPQMIQLDDSIDFVKEIEKLKKRKVSVIGLTARNHELSESTHKQLVPIGIDFSKEAISDAMFMNEGKLIQIKDGVIFASGRHKGATFKLAKDYLTPRLSSYNHITFIDDSMSNCLKVAETLQAMELNHTIWRYGFAEKEKPFTNEQKKIAVIQESHFIANQNILPDESISRRFELNQHIKAFSF